MVPQDLKFAKTHEWAKTEGDVVTIGISDFAVNQLGDIVFLELPGVGDSVTQGEAFGVIESVKAAVDLYAPVSGQVVEVNQPVTENFDVLGEDPFAKAWMIKVKIADSAQLENLMDASGYQGFLESPESQH